MIREFVEGFRTDVEAILENTLNHGIPPDDSGKVRFSDVGEAVIATEKWCWVSGFELRGAIAQMADTYILEGDFVIRKNGIKFPRLPEYPEAQDPPKYLFWGASKATFQKLLDREQTQKAELIRVVGDADVAACIAIFLTDFGENAPEMRPTIASIDAAAAAAAGMPMRRTPSIFYVVDQLSGDYCSVFGGSESALKKATWKVRLNETLYMEHSDQSRRAAEFLFRLKPQPEVERALLEYLRHSIAAVRRNVAQALGLPSFLSSFPLNAPTPSMEGLLEPVSVQPDTLKKMIDATREETDFEVLHWLLCSASAQFYGGKLKPFTEEMRTLTRLLDDRYGEEVQDDTFKLRAALTDSV